MFFKEARRGQAPAPQRPPTRSMRQCCAKDDGFKNLTNPAIRRTGGVSGFDCRWRVAETVGVYWGQCGYVEKYRSQPYIAAGKPRNRDHWIQLTLKCLVV